MEFKLRHVVGLEIVYSTCDAHFAVVVRERSGGRQCENYVSSGRDEGFEEVENGVVRADGVEGMGKGLALERFEDFGGYFWVSVVE